MTHTYTIEGMTCGNCVAKVKSELLKMGDVTEVAVQLDSPQATISMQKHIPVGQFQHALSKAGSYTITEANAEMPGHAHAAHTSWLAIYKPLLLIGIYIAGATLLIEAAAPTADWERWMRHFMAGFFLVFSFFKLLDLKGFADSYLTYDVIAKKWKTWGMIYPFVELAFGVAFLINIFPLATYAITFVVMSISIIGVLKSVLNKKKIQCACLGAVFNLPMSTITIIEDALMIGMSGWMLVSLL